MKTINSSWLNRCCILFSLFCVSLHAAAVEKHVIEQLRELDRRTQLVKEDTIYLNEKLLELAETLDYPATSQVAVFVSAVVADYFQLDRINLRIGQQQFSHDYNATERAALRTGGAQRVHTGNYPPGTYRMQAEIIGQLIDPTGNTRDYRYTKAFQFTKADTTHYIEVKVIAGDAQNQPVLALEEWK